MDVPNIRTKIRQDEINLINMHILFVATLRTKQRTRYSTLRQAAYYWPNQPICPSPERKTSRKSGKSTSCDIFGFYW